VRKLQNNRSSLNRIQAKAEAELSDEQAGFRPGRGTRDHITNIRIIMEKARSHRQPLYMCFVDFQKAFDCIGHEKLWWTLLDMGFPPHLVQLLSSLYRNQKAAVRLNGEISEWFRIYNGVRQGCVISPILFNIQLEIIMRQALEHYNGRFRIGGRRLSNLRYADDIVLLASSPEELQELVNRVCTAGVEYNLRINVKKTQVMTTDGSVISITADGASLTQVSEFTYL